MICLLDHIEQLLYKSPPGCPEKSICCSGLQGALPGAGIVRSEVFRRRPDHGPQRSIPFAHLGQTASRDSPRAS